MAKAWVSATVQKRHSNRAISDSNKEVTVFRLKEVGVYY